MTYSEAVAFIQAVSWLGCRPGLERITDLMHRLGDPQKELRYIHITGTNGKGSTAVMLASVLQEAGYTVGLFTSPHLRFYNERVKINGMDIPNRDLCAMAETVKPAVDGMEMIPSEFERFTAMAFLYFRQMKCDIVVLEVGLGGLLDCTNVIPAPEAAVITNIGLEHTEYLGNTLPEIAAAKAGIIKPGADVVLYGQSEEVEKTVRDKCAACGCPIRVTDGARLEQLGHSLSGQSFSYRDREGLHMRMLGTYQVSNAAVALDTIDILRRRGWDIPEAAVRQGLSKATWPGRFEVLRTAPLVLVDGAHNPNGAEELVRCLRAYLPGKKLTFVMGVMADKDYGGMLDIIAPLARDFIVVTPQNHRALASGDLKAQIEHRLRLPVRNGNSVSRGVRMALEQAGQEDAICVFGSLYQVGEARACFNCGDEEKAGQAQHSVH